MNNRFLFGKTSLEEYIKVYSAFIKRNKYQKYAKNVENQKKKAGEEANESGRKIS